VLQRQRETQGCVHELIKARGWKARRVGDGAADGLPLMAGGPYGRKDGKGNGRGFWVGINCLNWHAHREEKGRREGGSRADSARHAAAAGGRGEEERKGGKGRLTGGTHLSAP
jgi:hypothetical protein